jgi:hypothetical protein
MKNKHPGSITYYERVDGKEKKVKTTPIDQIPESMWFGETNKGRVPIVKVVAQPMGNGREIIEYGPKGEFIRSTIMLLK